jgi:hypothetical protein
MDADPVRFMPIDLAKYLAKKIDLLAAEVVLVVERL